MFDYRSDSEVCRYQSFEPGSLGDIEAFIGRLQGNLFDVPGTWFQLAIRLQESGQLIGDFGIHFLADEPRQVEIGFTLSPHYQGRGYATEAVIGVFDYLFGPLQKRRVFASVDPRNEPSVALLKRVGMRQEAHFRKSLWFKGEWVDDVVFGILVEEWNGR
jgi:RimJ/RimL family protein N-acetyltransferase